jgi:hypothetical protein
VAKWGACKILSNFHWNKMLNYILPQFVYPKYKVGASMAVIVWYPMQSLSIATKVLSLNPAQCDMYSMQRLSVTCGRSPIFFGYSGFLHQLNRPPWYNWNIVESGVNTITLALIITPKYLHLPVFLINTHIETFFKFLFRFRTMTIKKINNQ